MEEINPFILRCVDSEWMNPIPNEEVTHPEDLQAYQLQRAEYFRQNKLCAEQFKTDVLAECNLTGEPDADRLFVYAEKKSNIGCVGTYDILANIAVERGLYVKIPWR